jgi:hypothetical protein
MFFAKSALSPLRHFPGSILRAISLGFHNRPRFAALAADGL